MKLYYTLIQSIHGYEKTLGEYLGEQGIKYKSGVELWGGLWVIPGMQIPPHSYIDYPPMKVNPAKAGSNNPIKGVYPLYGYTPIKYYVVLIEEHELSAIKLSVDGIQIVQNCRSIEIRNTFRRYFRWFLK